MTAPIQAILSDLVAFDSRSHLSNAGIAGYCAAFLEQRGWSVRRLPYADSSGIAKVNLVAVTPLAGAVDARPELAHSGHLDVVPQPGGAGTNSVGLALARCLDGSNPDAPRQRPRPRPTTERDRLKHDRSSQVRD